MWKINSEAGSLCIKTVITNVVVQHTYDFKKADGESVKEDVSADVKDNYVQYHLKDDDSEVWVIDDFNRVSMDMTYTELMVINQTGD